MFLSPGILIYGESQRRRGSVIVLVIFILLWIFFIWILLGSLFYRQLHAIRLRMWIATYSDAVSTGNKFSWRELLQDKHNIWLLGWLYLDMWKMGFGGDSVTYYVRRFYAILLGVSSLTVGLLIFHLTTT